MQDKKSQLHPAGGDGLLDIEIWLLCLDIGYSVLVLGFNLDIGYSVLVIGY